MYFPTFSLMGESSTVKLSEIGNGLVGTYEVWRRIWNGIRTNGNKIDVNVVYHLLEPFYSK